MTAVTSSWRTTPTHQHWIMSSYMDLGQPGGGGRRYPLSTRFTACKTTRTIHNKLGYSCNPPSPIPRPYAGETVLGKEAKTNLDVSVSLKWFVSQTPYLVHQNTIAPHITGSGVLPIQQGLHVSMEGAILSVIQYQLRRATRISPTLISPTKDQFASFRLLTENCTIKD